MNIQSIKNIKNCVSNPIVRGWMEFIGVFIAILGLAAVIFELNEARKQRVEETVARSWTIVTTKFPGSSGKVAALEYLARQHVPKPLEGIDLSCKSMGGIELRNGNETCLRPTYLRGLDLSPDVGNSSSGANLKKANLSSTDLTEADLQHAILKGANLSGALLTNADLEGVDLEGADLEGADISGSDIKGTNFEGANLSLVNFHQAEINRDTNFTKSWIWNGLNTTGKPEHCDMLVVTEYVCKKSNKIKGFDAFLRNCTENKTTFRNFIDNCVKIAPGVP